MPRKEKIPWETEKVRRQELEQHEIDREIEFDHDLNVRSRWQHLENIEASNKLLALLRKHHHEPSDDMSNRQQKMNIKASCKLLELLQKHHGVK